MPSTGKQPCSNFKYSDEGGCFGPVPHECFHCKDGVGTVYWCANCLKDHHVGGYEACKVRTRCEVDPFYRDRPERKHNDH